MFFAKLKNVFRHESVERDVMREGDSHLKLLQDEFERRDMESARTLDSRRAANSEASSKPKNCIATNGPLRMQWARRLPLSQKSSETRRPERWEKAPTSNQVLMWSRFELRPPTQVFVADALRADFGLVNCLRSIPLPPTRGQEILAEFHSRGEGENRLWG